jgi:hypothetical protein
MSAPERPAPERTSELDDPAFLKYLRGRFRKPVEPDDEDFGPHDRDASLSPEEAAAKYREAHTRKIMRLYRHWKSTRK